MNLASWIILAIVIAIIVMAIRATFFKKEPKGGCCDVGDSVANCSVGCEHCSLSKADARCPQVTIKLIEPMDQS